MKTTTVLLAACALAGLCAAGTADVRTVRFEGLTPADGRSGLANPERGWRFEVGVGKLAGNPPAHAPEDWPFPRFKADGVTVTQAYCYLTDYHDRDIAPEKIAALEADCARARRDGVKFLLRFAYDAMPGWKPSPDLGRILAHIRQLTPTVRKNADVIYCLQIGWLGAWGEFHSSVRGLENDPKAVAAVVGATLAMLPPNRSTMMRRIAFKERALEAMGAGKDEVTEKTAWTDAPAARIGFFNDATLVDWNDSYTFTDAPFAGEGNREYERARREGLFTPVDGELFWTRQGNARPCFADGLRAIERLAHHRYTTFSLVHGHSLLDTNPTPWTIDGWKVTPVTGEMLTFYGIGYDPAYFAGVPYRTAYEFIRDHLGYRLALKSCEAARAGGAVKLALTFHNYGFAAPVNPRRPVLVLAKGAACREFPVDFDCRRMASGADCRVEATVPVPAEGERLGLWLPDEAESLRLRPEYAIRLATRLETSTAGGRLVHFLW